MTIGQASGGPPPPAGADPHLSPIALAATPDGSRLSAGYTTSALALSPDERTLCTQGRYDQPGDRFDTPTLIEIWRTAPYPHDGSAATVREVLSTANPNDRLGVTSHLSPQQLDDLTAFLLSL